MKNFWQRLITGIIFLIVVLGSILWHQYAYFLVFGVIVLLAMIEMKNLIKEAKIRVQTGWAIVTGIFVYTITFLISLEIITSQWLLLLVPMIISIFITELYRKSETPLMNIAGTLIVPFYIALPFSSLHFLAFQSGSYEYGLLLGFYIIIWINDIAAYLIGVKFGKRRLFERISPKKSWEGAIAGFIAALLSAFILSYYFKNLSLTSWLIVGGIISIMGVFGDLTESLIKRNVNKKDSGTLLPGHGGVLDRFDCVIFAAPMVFCYLMCLQHLFNF